MFSTATGPQAQVPSSDEQLSMHHPATSSGHPTATTEVDIATAQALRASETTKDDKKPFSFLKLSPELRNAIYEYTFKDDVATKEWSGLAPHALTRVSRQIRSESLGMYHQYPRKISIFVSSTQREKHFREWAETDAQLYQVLPKLEIPWKDPSAPATCLTVEHNRTIEFPADMVDASKRADPSRTEEEEITILLAG